MVLGIKGMHCGSCAFLIEDILKEQKGVMSAEVDFAKQTCEVEMNEEANPEHLIQAVHDVPGEEFRAQIVNKESGIKN